MKRIKKSGIMFFVIAVIFSLVGVAGTFMLINSFTKEGPMLVAKDEVFVGDPLKKEMFRTVNIPIKAIPKDAIPVDTDMTGYIALRDMGPNDILRKVNIVNINDKEVPFLSSRLRGLENAPAYRELNKKEKEELFKNLVAAEIPITSIKGILPHMTVGDRIAVTSVYSLLDKLGNEELKTEELFDYIDVLSIKKPTKDSEESGSLIIALTRNQFKALSLAREKGEFYIALMAYGIKKPENHPEILSEKYRYMIKDYEVEISDSLIESENHNEIDLVE